MPMSVGKHKALDLIGDFGVDQKASTRPRDRPEKAGHAMHFALVNRIMQDPTLYEILSFDQLATRVAHALRFMWLTFPTYSVARD